MMDAMNKIKIRIRKNQKHLLLIFVIVLMILFLVIKMSDSLEVKQAKEEYNNIDFKNTFLLTAKELENSIGVIIITSGIENEEDFKNQIKILNKNLKKQNWLNFNVVNPNILGLWYLNDEANIKFKFLNKDIEPSWTHDLDVKDYIELN